MPLKFQWDAYKEETNLAKHGVSFGEAATVFGDPRSITIPDSGHSEKEERYIILRTTSTGKMLVVVHTERDDSIRIISARPASRKERKSHEESS